MLAARQLCPRQWEYKEHGGCCLEWQTGLYCSRLALGYQLGSMVATLLTWEGESWWGLLDADAAMYSGLYRKWCLSWLAAVACQALPAKLTEQNNALVGDTPSFLLQLYTATKLPSSKKPSADKGSWVNIESCARLWQTCAWFIKKLKYLKIKHVRVAVTCS